MVYLCSGEVGGEVFNGEDEEAKGGGPGGGAASGAALGSLQQARGHNYTPDNQLIEPSKIGKRSNSFHQSINQSINQSNFPKRIVRSINQYVNHSNVPKAIDRSVNKSNFPTGPVPRLHITELYPLYQSIKPGQQQKRSFDQSPNQKYVLVKDGQQYFSPLHVQAL